MLWCTVEACRWHPSQNIHKQGGQKRNPQVTVLVPTCFGQGIETCLTDLKVNPLLMTFVSRNTLLHGGFPPSFCILKRQNNCIETQNQAGAKVKISVMRLTNQYKHFYIC